MTAPSYPTTCPKCGAQLQPVALDPYTAPWLCRICARGWWSAELSTSARSIYRQTHGDFGFSPERIAIQASIAIEIEEARVRGTSLREDHFTLTNPSVLANIAHRPGLDPTFAASLKVGIANRGVK
jgi:hypothetical protein